MPKIDVFLCHHRADQGAVKVLARGLQEESLKPCVDKWNLMPGKPWRDDLQQALDQSPTCVVFLGPNGLGPWEHEEMRAYLDRRVQDKSLRVVPVLLPGATMPQRGQLPPFLSRRPWVVFRNGLDDSKEFNHLVRKIRGVPPKLSEKIRELSTESPYRGLEKFGPEDAQWFFGRDSDVQQLVEKVKLVEEVNKVRFLAVLGASGSGKSSVVLAGLVPALKKGALPESEHWPVRIFTPTEQPLEELAVNLVGLFPGGRLEQMTQVGELLRDLEAHKRTLHLTVRQALKYAPTTHRVVLVVDQFEEAFTLCQNAAMREQFFANLLYASSVNGGRTIVVLTMRADFLAKCLEYPGLADRLSSYQFLVTPMSEEQLHDVISEPAKRAGLLLDPGLADLILKDLMDEPGGLPLLEHTLFELWQRRRERTLTVNAYHEIKGVTGALAYTANATYQSFNQAERQIAQRILLQLVQPGEGTEDTRRPVKRSDLIPSPENKGIVEGVLRRLADQRLVTTSQERETNEIVVNMAHEALIRNWPRLQKWINNNRESLRFHRRLREAAKEWERLQRDEDALYRGARLAQAEEWAQEHSDDLARQVGEFIEASIELAEREKTERDTQRHQALQQELALAKEQQQRVVLQRWALAGLSMLLLVAVAAAVFAFYQAAEAAQQTAKAEAARNQAEQQERIATAGQLAAQAQSVGEQDPLLRLLLALEALHVTEQADEPRVPAAEQALREALANTGGQRLSGHTDSINAVAINDQWLVTVSDDNTAQVWDIQQPEAPPTILEGHSESINAVAISNHWLVTASDDQTARLWDLRSSDPEAIVLQGHQGPIRAVAISDQWLITASDDKTARLWALDDPKTPAAILEGHTNSILAVAISEQWVVTASSDHTARLWALDDPKKIYAVLEGHTNSILAVAINEQWIVTASSDNTARLWNLQQLEEGDSTSIFVAESDHTLEGHTASIRAVAVSDQWVVTASSDYTARLWALDDPNTPHTILEGHTGRILAVAINEQWVVTASSDHTARVWDLEQPMTKPTVLKGHSASIQAVAMNNHWLVTGSSDETARLWDIRQPEVGRIVLRGHEESILDVAIRSDNDWLLTVSDDKTARLWNIDRPKDPPTILKGHESTIRVVAISPDNQWAVTAGFDKIACLRNFQQPKDCIELEGNEGVIEAVALSDDWVVIASSDQTARVWELSKNNSAEFKTKLEGHTGSINDVAISEHRVVTVSSDQTARLWDIQSLKATPIELKGHSGPILAVVISDKWVVTASSDKTARLWSLDDPETQRAILEGHTNRINAVAISDDWLVTASDDKTARLWDLREPEPKAIILRGHENSILDVAISDNWVVTASSDQTARLWDLQQPEALPVVLRDHTGLIRAVAISNKWIVTASADKTARLWPLRQEDLKKLGCRTAGRNLSQEEWDLYFSGQVYRKTCEKFSDGKGVNESTDSQPTNE